jgi:hypothetical protein
MIMRSFILVLGALIGGCRNPAPATEVLVVVDSDLAVGSALTNLRVRVYDREGKIQVALRDFALSPRRATTTFPLPLSYSLVPSDGVQQFRLVVTGQGPKDGVPQVDIVERQAIASFGEGKRLLLPIFLDGRCLNKLCRNGDEPQEETCNVGTCVTVTEVPLQPAGRGPTGDYDAAVFKSQLDDAGPDAKPDADTDGGADASADAGVDAASDSGPDAASDSGADADAGAGAQPCGTWVASNKDQAPPLNATALGVEYNDTAPYTFNQYVCRVRLNETTLVPGKGVYGYACYYIGLDNRTMLYADNFEVLIDTANCARMTSVVTARANGLSLLPTGRYGGDDLYSCSDSVESMGVNPPQPISHPLGRYDPRTETCYYEWYGGTRISMPGGSGQPTFSVLTR